MIWTLADLPGFVGVIRSGEDGWLGLGSGPFRGVPRLRDMWLKRAQHYKLVRVNREALAGRADLIWDQVTQGLEEEGM